MKKNNIAFGILYGSLAILYLSMGITPGNIFVGHTLWTAAAILFFLVSLVYFISAIINKVKK